MYVFWPASSPNTLGIVSVAGAVNTVPAGAWIVMSKVCCSRPGGSMSFTNAAGTGLMPMTGLATGLPLASSRLPGCTVSDSAPICWAVRFRPLAPAVSGLAVMTVGAVALSGWKMPVLTRGR